MTLEALLIEHFSTIAVAIPSLGVVIAYGYSIIRRRVSSDIKALKEDRSYVTMLENYKKERDELRAERERLLDRVAATEKERNEATAKSAKLETEVTFLNAQVIELKDLVEKLSTSLELSRSEMHRFALDNVKLVAHVSYLESLVEHKNGKDDPKTP